MQALFFCPNPQRISHRILKSVWSALHISPIGAGRLARARRLREVLLEHYAALRPGGRLIPIEYRQEDPEIPIIPAHKMSKQQARSELEAAGLIFVENPDFLPQQHFLVFARPGYTG